MTVVIEEGCKQGIGTVKDRTIHCYEGDIRSWEDGVKWFSSTKLFEEYSYSFFCASKPYFFRNNEVFSTHTTVQVSLVLLNVWVYCITILCIIPANQDLSWRFMYIDKTDHIHLPLNSCCVWVKTLLSDTKLLKLVDYIIQR